MYDVIFSKRGLIVLYTQIHHSIHHYHVYTQLISTNVLIYIYIYVCIFFYYLKSSANYTNGGCNFSLKSSSLNKCIIKMMAFSSPKSWLKSILYFFKYECKHKIMQFLTLSSCVFHIIYSE